jgi:hypothetical protein
MDWTSWRCGRTPDRKTKCAEDYLGEAIVALAGAATLAKHRRAEAEKANRNRGQSIREHSSCR